MGDGSQTGGDVGEPVGRARALLTRGARLGPYRIGEELGRGGMGRVLRAHDERLDRDVALKLLDIRPRVDEHSEPRMRREAQALAQVDHPNVVRVFDVGVVAGVPFIALEYVRGVTLQAWLVQKRHTVAEILRVFVDAGRGLAAVHAAGLVHRDFKPGNVMIADAPRGTHAYGRARVMDFGLARLAEHDGTRSLPSGDALAPDITRTGAVLGTPIYMAPEQHRGEVADARADQYAFAIALFEALHGRHPFAEGRPDHVQLAVAKHSGRFVAVPDGEVPKWLDLVLKRALATKPEDRWPSMDVLVQRLRRAGRRRRIGLGAVAMGAVALAVLVGVPASGEPTRCDAAAALGDAWDDDRRAALADAWAAAPGALARHSGPTVVAALDDYAARWTTAWQNTCVAMSEDAAELDGAMACLADARRDLHATAIALAGELDARASEQAMATVLGLAEPGQCCRIVGSRPPEAAEQAEMRDALVQVKASTRARRFDEATRLLHEIETELRDRPQDGDAIAAEWLLRRAELASAKGEYPAARDDFEAAWHAAWAAGDDALATSAVTSLVDLLGGSLAQPVEALRIVPDAEALAARVGDPNLDARLDRAIGRALNAKADYPAAIERLERALEVRMRIEPVDAIELAVIHDSLARAVGRSGDPQEAREHSKRAIAVAEAALGPDHPHVVAYMGNLASLLSSQGDQAGAEAIILEALARLERSVGSDHRVAVPMLMTLGIIWRMRGDSAKAAEYHERCLAIARALTGDHDTNVARARSNLADDLADLGRFDEAYAHAETALIVVEDILGPDHPQAGSVHDTLGLIELRRHNREAALVHYRKAVDNWRRRLGEYDDDVAGGWSNVGSVELELRRWQDARASFERSITAFERSGTAKSPNAAGAYAGLGRALVGLGEPLARTLPPFERALEVYAEAGPDPRYLASMRFDLAELLWQRPSERPRALALADAALADLHGLDDTVAKDVRANVGTWLATRSKPRSRARRLRT